MRHRLARIDIPIDNKFKMKFGILTIIYALTCNIHYFYIFVSFFFIYLFIHIFYGSGRKLFQTYGKYPGGGRYTPKP